MGAISEQIVYTASEDQRAQAGVLMQPAGAAARPIGIICIHSAPGFFYFPAYVNLGRALAQHGYRFVSGSTRAHDIVTLDIPWPYRFRHEDFARWRVGGAGLARWEEGPRNRAGL
jgi:hypothetical protein